jgi:polyphosphate kinase 2 (PPK2 family)
MLEQVDLKKKLDKIVFLKEFPELQELHKACWDHKVPSMIVFEGWDASGKGSAVNVLTEPLDPRGFKLYPIQAPRYDEMQRHWLYRFWLKVPRRGQLVIFDRSWYGRVGVERVEKLTPRKLWRAAYQEIVDFERVLADDGVVIMKFFLHISAKEQRRRFERIEKDPFSKWQVTKEDWEHHKKYDEYWQAYEDMLAQTDTAWGPWTLVESTSRYYAQHKILSTIINRLEAKLGDQVPVVRPVEAKGLDEDDEADADIRKTMTVKVLEANGG